jgi:F-type H+-transporting ATPase subunit alpha
VPIDEIKRFRKELIAYFETNCSDVIDEINSTKVLSPELENKIVEAAKVFKQM